MSTSSEVVQKLSRTRKADVVENVIAGARPFIRPTPNQQFWTPPGDTRSPFERWRDDAKDAVRLVEAPDWLPLLDNLTQNPVALSIAIEDLRALGGCVRRGDSVALDAQRAARLHLRSTLAVWGDHITDLTNGYGQVTADFSQDDYVLFTECNLERFLSQAAGMVNGVAAKRAVRALLPAIEGRIEADSFRPAQNAELWHAGWALISLAWLLADELKIPLTFIRGATCCTLGEAQRSRMDFAKVEDVTCPRCEGRGEVERGDAEHLVALRSVYWECSACDIVGYFPLKAPAKSIWNTPSSPAQTGDGWLGYSEDDAAQLMEISSRTAFDRDVQRAFDEAVDECPFSVVMLDVDHFKNVNDTFGHQVGDRVLIEVARLVRQAVGRRGRAYRYGGEEVVLILPDFANGEAVAVAERVRCAVEEFPWSTITSGLHVTLSAGVAQSHADAYPATVIKRADDALYAAKRSGRNRVEVVSASASVTP